MKSPIDLRSDTVTRPTPGMLQAMMDAKVGDDVFGDDPTVIALEERAAELFGKAAAVYCPSGTMTNQIAVRVHTHPGDEVICDALSHVYHYEGGGMMANSGVSVRLVHGDRGRFKSVDVLQNINPDDIHHPRTRLVIVENTCNKGGGSIWDIEEIRRIYLACQAQGLKLHLDGARIFNALAVTGESSLQYGQLFDSVSVCLSKGLGAPVGSVLIGENEFIRQARRVRKLFGGAMRQSGFLAAAGLYALDHHTQRVKEDHLRARSLAQTLSGLSYVKDILPVDTNILIFTLQDGISTDTYLKKLQESGVLALDFGPQKIRMITHLDFGDEELVRVQQVLQEMKLD
ncbi:MAG: GntG family PLP-dependent aldolase [Bacteroidales bacterium]|nr:aminotransferase class I/II-fold pyridoxal phosphate-dependent enzyme [Lentimicrobiaceae bacterium]MDD5694422.1 GntG family PLP-dependent aldolase [Bacteroidales bacterium]